MRRVSLILVILSVLFATLAMSASPPGLVNYQGVLRDASGAPLDGTHDMVFSFFDASTGGNELLLDHHTAAVLRAVTVSGGLFNVLLGSGDVVDGSASCHHDRLPDMFRSHGAVWMEIDVGGETLSPRIPLVATAYASNADFVDGKDAASFLDKSSLPQTKIGPLEIDASSAALAYGIASTGTEGGGHFSHATGSGVAILGNGDSGLHAAGTVMGGSFEEIDGSGYARLAWDGVGVNAQGNSYGGLFQDTGQTGYVVAGWGDRGIYAEGNEYGGYFNDSNDSSEAYLARGSTGIEAYGSSEGAYFADTDGSGYARIGYDDLGVNASGNGAGGYFADGDGSGSAYVGYEDVGIEGVGETAGALFYDLNSTGTAWLGYGDRGIHAFGNSYGGFFTDGDGIGYAYLGQSNRGVNAYGSDTAGYFEDSDLRSRVWVANLNTGISAHGNNQGGYFLDIDSGSYARVGSQEYGIEAYGDLIGGYFKKIGASSFAQLGLSIQGIVAEGTYAGGEFWDLDSGTWGHVGKGSYTIDGNGSKNFVQNHPYDKSKVVVFSAIEGDEVATYTRGSARLLDGIGRVPLSEAFRLVTNPDIGLTAQVTPRGPGTALYVESVTTSELVVRAEAGSSQDATFDYMVAGLRIGFEEVSVIRGKEREAYIPSMDDHLQRYEQDPGLRRYNAMERFKEMRQGVGERDMLDLSASDALRGAIGRFDPAVHKRHEEHRTDDDFAGFESAPDAEQATSPPDESSRPVALEPEPAGLIPQAEVVEDQAAAEPPLPALTSTMPVTEAMEAGDVVIIDRFQAGLLSLARIPGDALLFGVVIEGMAEDTGEVTIAHAGVVTCKVDAGYGEIHPGDLLTSSPTPGHAMLAVNPSPGTVLGKAIEPLEAGAGVIRVLVTMR